VRDEDKAKILPSVKRLADLGFKVLATGGTAALPDRKRRRGDKINKVLEGRPHIEDAIRNRQVQLVFNTTDSQKAVSDSNRSAAPPDAEGALLHHHGRHAASAAEAIAALKAGSLEVRPLQEYF
jgi:carbamoyl-phosphate synthase large subunit